jgi:SPP1 gp7 family putative phage head morphogenesis protein
LRGVSKAEPIYYGDGEDALTPEQAAALKEVVNALSPDGWSQALYDEMTILLEAGWLSASEILQEAGKIEAGFEGTVPSLTLDAIRQKAEDFAFMVNGREHQALFDVIDNAIATGQTPKELAGVVADTFAAGYHITSPGTGVVTKMPTDAWSEMVARTELSRAQTAGQMALYEAAGIEHVMWVTNQGATVCDECADADGQVLPIGDPFDGVDTDEPPAHPNCCCALMAADEDITGSEAA